MEEVIAAAEKRIGRMLQRGQRDGGWEMWRGY